MHKELSWTKVGCLGSGVVIGTKKETYQREIQRKAIKSGLKLQSDDAEQNMVEMSDYLQFLQD